MPTTKELSIQLENRPGTLARVCKALADGKVNVMAFQASAGERKSQIRIVVDNLPAAKKVLDNEGTTYTEEEVVQVMLPNRPGELARIAARLGEANINIDYAYVGMDPGTNKHPLLFLGVGDVRNAAKVIDQASAAAGSS